MKVNSSTFLLQKKSLLKKLLNQLLDDFSYVSILASDCYAKQYSVSKRGTSIGEIPFLSNRGFVVKVYDGGSYTEYSFNEIDDGSINSIVSNIKTSIKNNTELLCDGITKSNYNQLEDEVIHFSESTDYIQDPLEFGDESFVSMLTSISEKGRSYSDKILDCSAFSNFQYIHKLFLSKNKDMEQNILWTTGGLVVMASRGEEIKDYYKGYSVLGGSELLQNILNDVDFCAKSAMELLDSKPMTPGIYDCICAPDVTGMIVHEAFGHGVEMDMFVKKRALAENFINDYVASPLITMHDGASAAKEVASYFFDDEGTLASDTVIIDQGILRRGISDAQSAMQLNTTPTGNGRRESFERKAYTRMTNTFFEAGNDTVEDMISSISYGFLLENASSGMEDPKNWGIQCMVNIAREIVDGKLTGTIFSPIVLTGYVPDLLKSISMLSNHVELGGGGFCGKGYKEWVKVSDGGPYMKAQIRLG